MYKKYFILFLIFCNVLAAVANKRLTDSLELRLKKADSEEKFSILLKLSEHYFMDSPEKSFKTCFEAKSQLSDLSAIQKAEYFKTLGLLYHKSNKYDSAVICYRTIIQVSENNNDIANALNNTGIIFKEIGVYDSARYYHTKALKLYETLGNKFGAASSLNNIGNVYLKKDNYLQALEFYQQSLELKKQIGDENEIAATLLNIGDVYKKQNNYDKALALLTEALAMREKSKNKQTIAYTLNAIGNFYLQLKIYDKAREYYSKALNLRQEENDKVAIAATYGNIGTVHKDLENYDKALEYFQKSLDLRRELDNKEEMALSLNNIGSLFWKQKKYKEALDYYKMSLELRLKVGDRKAIANSYKNLGILYKDMGNFSNALQNYENALAINMDLQDMKEIAYLLNLKGNMYRKNTDYEKSFSYYQSSLETYKQIADTVGMALIAQNLGESYMENKQNEKAIEFLLRSVFYAEKVKLKSVTQNAYQALATIYESKNDYKNSLLYFKKHTALRDSIQSDMSKRRIAEIEFESDIKLKDKEIEKKELINSENQVKIAQQRILIIISLIVIILVIVFSILLYLQFSQKKAAFKLLDEKNAQLGFANTELEKKNLELAEKNEKITDSITYAKKIQQAILPSEKKIKEIFPQSFIFYHPKEIVSGDFYWFEKKGSKVFYAAVDCTGHGVPGAFMSMIGNTLLNEIINEKHETNPAEILTQLDAGVIKALKQDDFSTDRQEDGMEISLLCYDIENNTLQFAGANHKLLIVKNGELIQIAGDIFPIGGMVAIKNRKNAKFTFQNITIEEGMSVYMCSDGFIDQFGSEKDERYTSTRLNKLLVEINKEYMNEQYTTLSKHFDDWKGNRRQIDDVLIIGIKF
ncbi:MAG: tetratricopeptide repeat protein [Bacteroidales bacterium]|nr:tetratricopeptide repeat protein [Bacteroidales bacterium]